VVPPVGVLHLYVCPIAAKGNVAARTNATRAENFERGESWIILNFLLVG